MYVALILSALMSIGPLLIVVVNSLRPNMEIFTDPLGLPKHPALSNYAQAWGAGAIGGYLLNSVLVTAGSLALGLAVSLPIAYALGRWQFLGKRLLSVLFVAGMMVPIRLGVLPLFHLYEATGLIDTRIGLMLINAAAAMPTSVLIITAFYRALPASLFEAAHVDGAGELQTFWRIGTPLVRPAVVTAAVMNVGPAWNDFFFPLIMLRSPSRFTIPVGISSFFGEHTVDRGLLFAGLVIAVAPLAIMFAFAMRLVVGGLTAGMER
ncbi:carbohydrate ABC transporter permease [Kribbella sp. GL6]|uniref:carbohydrate ABC transporter permease n=1 Tax=Kribbella sp. GL6 TaxID=3419765 RepID=UPI003CFF33F2